MVTEVRTFDSLNARARQRVVRLREKARASAAEERTRQDQRWGYFRAFAADEWLAILGEEVGELAESLCAGLDKASLDAAYTEAIQVAASALQIAEALLDDRVTAPATVDGPTPALIEAGQLCRIENEARALLGAPPNTRCGNCRATIPAGSMECHACGATDEDE